MGLDVSHDAWHGAYSAFNRFRQAVCWAAGGIFPNHDLDSVTVRNRLDELGIGLADNGRWYVPDAVTREAHPGLYVFLEHSDCDGQISPENCVKVANDLEKLLDTIDGYPIGVSGHIARHGSYRGALEQFIKGCRAAAEANEPLCFY